MFSPKPNKVNPAAPPQTMPMSTPATALLTRPRRPRRGSVNISQSLAQMPSRTVAIVAWYPCATMVGMATSAMKAKTRTSATGPSTIPRSRPTGPSRTLWMVHAGHLVMPRAERNVILPLPLSLTSTTTASFGACCSGPIGLSTRRVRAFCFGPSSFLFSIDFVSSLRDFEAHAPLAGKSPA
eukprot:scaffold37109_cov63-Phaeocystis_antarctica.AAC.1